MASPRERSGSSWRRESLTWRSHPERPALLLRGGAALAQERPPQTGGRGEAAALRHRLDGQLRGLEQLLGPPPPPGRPPPPPPRPGRGVEPAGERPGAGARRTRPLVHPDRPVQPMSRPVE